jgi:hypothetical protein
MKTRESITSIMLVICFIIASSMTADAQKRRERPARYKNMPRIGNRVTHVPRTSYRIPYKKTIYHYHSGVFYKPFNRFFIIVNAPIGIRIRTLPPHHYRVIIGTRLYYYEYGSFYVQKANYYESVVPPLGAHVEELPEGYYKIVIEGRTYYELNGVYYKAVVDDKGEVWYEVVGINHDMINDQ